MSGICGVCICSFHLLGRPSWRPEAPDVEDMWGLYLSPTECLPPPQTSYPTLVGLNYQYFPKIQPQNTVLRALCIQRRCLLLSASPSGRGRGIRLGAGGFWRSSGCKRRICSLVGGVAGGRGPSRSRSSAAKSCAATMWGGCAAAEGGSNWKVRSSGMGSGTKSGTTGTTTAGGSQGCHTSGQLGSPNLTNPRVGARCGPQGQKQALQKPRGTGAQR